MTPPEVSVIVVNHRSSAHALRCLDSLRSCFAADLLRGEIILVDCASGEEDVALLAAAPADVSLFLEENRGYSGGVNAGLARARGEKLILGNADVIFSPGALGSLLRAIADPSVGAAAPVAHWDAGGRILLPTGFAPGFVRDLAQLKGGGSTLGDARRFASFARETLSLWKRGGRASHLTGAVLAARRDVFDRVGRFDESFPFEYEETEWEDRVRAAGLGLLCVAEARVRHLWARSAAASPATARRRADSRRLYRERRYGPLGRLVLEAMDGRRPASRPARVEEPVFSRREGAFLALSPNPTLLPFAGVSLDRDFRLPEEIAETLPAGPLYLRLFRESDCWPIETRVWEKN